MSLIATNPFARCTYEPSRAMLQNRQPSRCFGTDSLLGHTCATHRDELPDRRVDEPGRVVVAVASAWPVDEHRVDSADLALPAAQAELVGERTQARPALLLDRGRDSIVPGGERSGAGRVREDVHLGQPGPFDCRERLIERGVVLGRKADDDVARQVE